MTACGVQNIMTLDVEDYMYADPWRTGPAPFPVSAQVMGETQRALDLLDDLGVVATCFVVGRVAEAFPHVVSEIVSRGHEVASHGYHHVRMQFHTPASFREDLRQSLAILQDLTGRTVRGFRAPGFSLGVDHTWAFDVMAGLGIVYDSSVRLVWPGGLAAGERLVAAAAATGIREVPGFKLGIGRLALPLAGGGGLRILPEVLTVWAIRKLNARGFTVPIYLHPYDMAIIRPAGPWHRSTPWGRQAMHVTHALQRAGRQRVGSHLRRVIALSEVTTMERYIQLPARPSASSGTALVQ